MVVTTQFCYVDKVKEHLVQNLPLHTYYLAAVVIFTLLVFSLLVFLFLTGYYYVAQVNCSSCLHLLTVGIVGVSFWAWL